MSIKFVFIFIGLCSILSIGNGSPQLDSEEGTLGENVEEMSSSVSDRLMDGLLNALLVSIDTASTELLTSVDTVIGDVRASPELTEATRYDICNIIKLIIEAIGSLVKSIIAIARVIIAALGQLVGVILKSIKLLLSVFKAILNLIFKIIIKLFELIASLIVKGIHVVEDLLQSILQCISGLLEFVRTLIDCILGTIVGILKSKRANLQVQATPFIQFLSEVITSLDSVVVSNVEKMKTSNPNLPESVIILLNVILDQVNGMAKSTMDQVTKIQQEMPDRIDTFLLDSFDQLCKALEGLSKKIESIRHRE